MDFDLVLRSRHSVRVFSEKPVTRDILRKIVEDAGRAPSWVNAQEWHVYMATEKTLKNIRAEYMALAEKGDQGMALSVKITFATLSVLHGVVKHAIFAGVYR